MGSNYVSIGEMKSSGYFSRITAVTNDTGGQDEGTTGIVVSNVRGKLTKKGGQRTIEAGHLTIVKTYLWQCYFQSAIDDEVFKSKMQWVIDGMVFTVIDWEAKDNFFYEFLLTKNEDYDSE